MFTVEFTADHHSFNPSKVLKIVVGKETYQREFTVHEDIICRRSEFFRGAMNGNWPEMQERVIRFPEDRPSVFNLYIYIIYFRKFPELSTAEARVSDVQHHDMVRLSRLYVLCEKLMDIASKNATLRFILYLAKQGSSDGELRFPTPEAISIMYEGTPENSPGRLLFAHLGTSVPVQFLKRSSHKVPNEFLADLAIALHTYRPAGLLEQTLIADESQYMEAEK